MTTETALVTPTDFVADPDPGLRGRPRRARIAGHRVRRRHDGLRRLPHSKLKSQGGTFVVLITDQTGWSCGDLSITFLRGLSLGSFLTHVLSLRLRLCDRFGRRFSLNLDRTTLGRPKRLFFGLHIFLGAHQEMKTYLLSDLLLDSLFDLRQLRLNLILAALLSPTGPLNGWRCRRSVQGFSCRRHPCATCFLSKMWPCGEPGKPHPSFRGRASQCTG